MKAVFFKNPTIESTSFHSQEDHQGHFYDTLHYHPEIQITYILESEGTLFAGDKIDRFKKGDIFLFGANLPHVFRNDSEYYEENSNLIAHSYSIHFQKNCFGSDFFESPEMTKINALLQSSERGLKISSEQISHKLFQQIQSDTGVGRILGLLRLLHKISSLNNLSHLSSISYSNPQKESHNQRINSVFEFVVENFENKINLDDIAKMVHMSAPAFSRFFKQRTRKTFTRFVNEVRTGNACKLLQNGQLSISEIAYQCGFNNISNFNRQFKRITSFTPKAYQKAHRIN